MVVSISQRMKSRLTNSYFDLVKQVECELSKPFSNNSLVVFSVFPSLGRGYFSIQVVEELIPFIVIRKWSQDLGDSSHLGIYNLDNLKIEEEKMNISDEDILSIRAITKTGMWVKDLSEIILDGVDFELRVTRPAKVETYHWRIEEQISVEMKELVRKLIDIAGLPQMYL